MEINCFNDFLLPILSIVIAPFSKLSGKISEKLQKNNSLFIEKIINSFSSIMYIKSINAETEIEKDLDIENLEIQNQTININKLNVFMPSFIMFLLLIIISMIFIYGSYRVKTGDISLGVLISFLLYIFQLLTPISSINNYLSSKEKDKLNKPLIDKYIMLKHEEQDINSKSLSNLEKIEFNNVDFSYGSIKVLDNLSLNIEKGAKVAIVGPSGSGKSTIYKLLLNFYNVNDGKLLLNDLDINEYSRKSIREKFVFIPQENSIIGSNLYDFITLGNKDVSDEYILEILEKVALKNELSINKNNLRDIDFGIGANKLSTGQNQRVMVVKSIISNGDVYLLDESTASIDSELETKIFNILATYKKEETILSIAHRLSTVKYANRVIFLEDGKVTGDGNHSELYEKHERYKKFVDLQMIKND